jgi:hypothetical protein
VGPGAATSDQGRNYLNAVQSEHQTITAGRIEVLACRRSLSSAGSYGSKQLLLWPASLVAKSRFPETETPLQRATAACRGRIVSDRYGALAANQLFHDWIELIKSF